MADFRVRNEISIITIEPVTDTARQWLDENLETEPWQWLGDTLCLDWRMSDWILQLLIDNGFEVEAVM